MRLDEAELVRWGACIGASVATPVVIALRGPLGAGKSVLARAIGAGAGVDVTMPSPTYNVLLRYDLPTGRAVVHVDLYRLEDPDQVWELGWSDLGGAGEIDVIEWPDRAGPHMPESYWEIELSVSERHGSLRDISVRRVGEPPDLPGFPITVSVASG